MKRSMLLVLVLLFASRAGATMQCFEPEEMTVSIGDEGATTQ